MKKILFFSLIVGSLFFSTNISNAQSADLDKQLTVDVVPNIPGPQQSTDISIESYMYDLSRAKISWYVNGALRSSDIGQKSFTFTTGRVGQTTKITYQIQVFGGPTFGSSLSFTPAEVNLVWESLGYTPPFYKGKSLFSFEGTARIVAVPNILASNGTKYKSEELVYTWKNSEGHIFADQSGYGKNTFIFNGDIIARPQEISVEVSNLAKTTTAQNSITIEAVQPEIYVYENSPSLGILFNKEVGGRFNLQNSEVSLVAMPFYFNNPDKDANYSWFINGQDSNEVTRFITLRNVNDEQGQSNISVGLDNQVKIMQSAQKDFSIFMQSSQSKDTTSL